MTLLDILRKLREQGPDDPGVGICYFIESHTPDEDEGLCAQFEDLCETWPEFSGYSNFPVPHPSENPNDAYCLDVEAKWDHDTPYGAARWRLVHWCIEQLEAGFGH